jgi:hypothetical protein
VYCALIFFELTIPCADGHGDYDDKFDGTGETEAIDVVFRCYTEESDGNYTAWFGYNNTNDHLSIIVILDLSCSMFYNLFAILVNYNS